jgi:hypothetical protein
MSTISIAPRVTPAPRRRPVEARRGEVRLSRRGRRVVLARAGGVVKAGALQSF